MWIIIWREHTSGRASRLSRKQTRTFTLTFDDFHTLSLLLAMWAAESFHDHGWSCLRWVHAKLKDFCTSLAYSSWNYLETPCHVNLIYSLIISVMDLKGWGSGWITTLKGNEQRIFIFYFDLRWIMSQVWRISFNENFPVWKLKFFLLIFFISLTASRFDSFHCHKTW